MMLHARQGYRNGEAGMRSPWRNSGATDSDSGFSEAGSAVFITR
jgi:hypothetical protein